MSNLASLFDRYKALVIFDTETSGLNPGDDQIIELAALRVERTQAGALRIAGKMDTFIKLPEGEQLPENIVTLTGITDRLLEAEGVQPSEAVEIHQYAGARPKPTQSVKDAVAAVFDRGETVVDEPVLYFYNPAIVESEWHESQIFVIEVGGHRFFAERSAAQ